MNEDAAELREFSGLGSVCVLTEHPKSRKKIKQHPLGFAITRNQGGDDDDDKK